MSRTLAFLLALFCAVPAWAAESAKTILILGDSLSAGFGIAVEQSWPALLDRRLKQEGLPYAVANLSISGETSAGGRSRLPEALDRLQPAVVVIALGANDGLRGLPAAQLRDNLKHMIRAAKAHRAKVLLVGMHLPPNYGADYGQAFTEAYRSLATGEKVALLPFLLEPIALDDAAYQADRLHPTAAAQPKVLDHVWTRLKPLLR